MMAEKNTLEKLTFVRLYDAHMDVCSLTRTTPGGLPGVARESSNIAATFEAAYCAEQMILLVTRAAENSAYWKLKWLPERRIETIGGLDVTKAIDTIYEKSREWRETVREIVMRNAPGYEIVAAGELTRVLDEVAAQVNAGALGPDVTAEVVVPGGKPAGARK